MDDLMVCMDDFQQALDNLEKVLVRCKETSLSLSNKKSRIFLTKGIVLGQHILSIGIKVDPTKIDIISQVKIPSSQK